MPEEIKEHRDEDLNTPSSEIYRPDWQLREGGLGGRGYKNGTTSSKKTAALSMCIFVYTNTYIDGPCFAQKRP